MPVFKTEHGGAGPLPIFFGISILIGHHTAEMKIAQ
jgi:hypothetical protein